MFGFFSKNVKDGSIKKYKSAIRAIKIYISLGLYQKAINACEEIIIKEKVSLENLIKKIGDTPKKEKLIKKETEIFNNRKEEIKRLREKASYLNNKYKEKKEKEKFKKKFKELKKDLRNQVKIGKTLEAMNELKFFLKENKDRVEVVSFYNEEKKFIQKAIKRQKEELRKKIENNTEAEAMQLIGKEFTKEKEEKIKESFWSKIKKFFKKDTLKQKIEEEKILDEVNKLLKENDDNNKSKAKAKLENVHKGLVKEIRYNKLVGYDVYGKILGADKISGDAFGIDEKKDRYTLFLGDATGHGIRAGFIITMLNKGFRKFRDRPLKEMAYEVNNSLKQNLESRNFVTGAFFDIEKKSHKLSYVGMGHEPIIFFKNKEKTAEKKVLGGLAAGIRIMKDVDNVKVRELEMQDGDLFIIYSDGIVEAKNDDGEYYGIDRLRENFKLIASNKKNLEEIYEYIMKDLKLFRGGSRFDDDASILIIKRDKSKDLIEKNDNYIQDLKAKENLNRKEAKSLEGKTKKEINEELEKIRKKREIERIVRLLKNTYYNGEILKLKQEAIRYVKEGYIDKRINYYLKKALENEKKYKIEQKNQKMQNKYRVLEELFKKGNYETVIKEAEDIIAKDGTS